MAKSFIETVVSSASSSFTCEVYPPRDGAEHDRLVRALQILRDGPCRGISVTCSSRRPYAETQYTARLVRAMTGLPVLVHIACGGLTPDEFLRRARELELEGSTDLLVVRGDPLERGQSFVAPPGTLRYAADAIALLRRCELPVRIAAACHPEGHGEATDSDVDFWYLLQKISCGVDLLVTQMAYQAPVFRRFTVRLRERGVSTPILAGILPLTSVNAARGVSSLGKVEIPDSLLRELASASDLPSSTTARLVGLGHALELARELRSDSGVKGVHLFRTMNPGSLQAFGQVFA